MWRYISKKLKRHKVIFKDGGFYVMVSLNLVNNNLFPVTRQTDTMKLLNVQSLESDPDERWLMLSMATSSWTRLKRLSSSSNSVFMSYNYLSEYLVCWFWPHCDGGINYIISFLRDKERSPFQKIFTPLFSQIWNSWLFHFVKSKWIKLVR